MFNFKKTIASTCAAAVLAFGITAVPAEAQRQAGLVNVAIGDVTTGDILSNITIPVQAAVNLAANVCGVSVDVITVDLAADGIATCSNTQNNRSVQITRR